MLMLLLLSQAQPLDWRALAERPAQVLFVGDVHDFRADKEELQAHLSELKAGGVGEFGFEMFGSDRQRALEDFCAGGDKSGGIGKDMGSWGWKTQEVEDLLGAVCRAGLKPVALDMPYLLQRGFDGTPARLLDARDAWMADLLHKRLAASGTRVLAFVGGLHAWPERLPRRLRAAGNTAASVQFIVDRDEAYRGVKASDVVGGIKEAGLAKGRWMFPAAGTELSRVADWLIWIPPMLHENPEAEQFREENRRFHH